MTDVRIARLRKHYRLPAGDTDARARLDRAVARALDEAVFEAALVRAGVRDGEEVCVRRLHVPAVLRRDAGEPQLAAAWSLAIARALDEALRDGATVVRYGSRHGALRELAARAPRGDLSRAWAWRRLGLWTLGDAPSPSQVASEIVATLAREPEAAVATLAAAANAGTLPALLTGAPAHAWHALAAAVLARLGAPRDLLDAAVPDASVRNAAMPDAPVPDALVPDAPAPDALVPNATRPEDDGPPLARAFAAALRTMRATPELARALAALAIAHAEPDALRAAGPEIVARLAGTAARLGTAARRGTTTRRTDADAKPRAAAVPGTRRHDDDDDVQPADARPRGRTEAAGVLFLLHLVRALDLPALLAAMDALRDRGVRWTLHRIAVDALGMDDRDPAALAFAGLGPDQPAPNLDAPPCDRTEREVIDVLIARLAATLRVWLPGDHRESDATLLARICRRRGEIVADPAWIEALLPLDEVDPLVRRAGLDVDPGWCPFIGAVVRFRYV